MDMVLLLGVVTGMRSMTAIAVLCWAAWLGDIPEHGWGIWIAYLVSAIFFSACATGEYVADTLPRTPNRTDHGPAIARVVIGALVGALTATAIHEPLAGGIIFGGIGALIGTWGSFWVRMSLSRAAHRDRPIALLESASALALAILAVVRLHNSIVIELRKVAG